jgi:hypothetical protein
MSIRTVLPRVSVKPKTTRGPGSPAYERGADALPSAGRYGAGYAPGLDTEALKVRAVGEQFVG